MSVQYYNQYLETKEHDKPAKGAKKGPKDKELHEPQKTVCHTFRETMCLHLAKYIEKEMARLRRDDVVDGSHCSAADAS